MRKAYKFVIFVFGNHDLYLPTETQIKRFHGRSSKKIERLKENFSENENVVILNNEKVKIDGVTVAGTRLWYAIPDEDKIAYSSFSSDAEYLHEADSKIEPWRLYHKRDKNPFNYGVLVFCKK